MANPLIRNGVLLMQASGVPAFAPEESGSCLDTECVGVNCPDLGPQVNPPSMVLQVFDENYLDASGDIDWCGETWTPQDVRDGICYCVCPDTYNVNTSYFGASSYVYGENWAKNNGTAESLALYRNANVQFTGLLYTFGNGVRLKSSSGKNRYFWNFASPTPYGTIATPAGFTPLNGVVKPNRVTEYRLGDEWFSSVTISDVLYSWTKGERWP